MIRAHQAGVQLILSIHDQLIALAAEADGARDMARLREAMEGVKFDVPMLTDGKIGHRWGDLMMEEPNGTDFDFAEKKAV